tara:strand:- start:768 stop:2039 length:1272 start_codon:yes stop_codon:yes gene_type:complete
MKKTKKFYVLFIFFTFLILAIFLLLNNKQFLYKKLYQTFFKLPDPVKSIFMIVSGRRSFSNVFNDYNVKFLPETQFLNIDFQRKKTDVEGGKVLWDKFNFSYNDRRTFFLEVFKDQVLIISKNGYFYKTNINNLNQKNKNLNYFTFKTNIKFKYILDTLIIKNKIYISTYSEINDCISLEIYDSDINTYLNFKIFKKFKECGNHGMGGGRMQPYKLNNKNGILLSTSDLEQDAPTNKPQEDNSIFGKLLFINVEDKEYEIFSKGHRNIQGLVVEDNLILSTEHGPRGGDELNKIIYKSNYGWPIASYGESYKKSSKLKYLKNHIDNGFVEPIYAFVPSIGISELLIVPDDFDNNWKNSLLVTSLNGRSIYIIKFQSKKFNKIIYIEPIFIGERIRDIKYIEKINAFIIALERTGDIGILKKIN